MENLPKLFIMAALLAFLLAIVTVFTGPIMASLPAEAFSRACSNLALLAIGIALAWHPAHE